MIADFEILQKLPSPDLELVSRPFIGDAFADQGLARHQSGDAAGALESFEKANLYSPGMAEYLHYRGLARQAVGDTKGANEDFETEKQSFRLKSRD
jgi:Flp pilus assembly protein TadD